jgi:hypothetical protein
MRNSQCVARTAVTKLRVDHEHMDTALDLSYAITDVRMPDTQSRLGPNHRAIFFDHP